MKEIIAILALTFLNFTSYTHKCAVAKQKETDTIDEKKSQTLSKELLINNADDSLFMLIKELDENYVKIIPPKNFEFVEITSQTEITTIEDFNADGKKDVLVNLKACGTGGCLAGLFLNQHANYYKLAFLDYLKNPKYEKEKEGLWTIRSSEELEAYNPSKLKISVFKFNKVKYKYELDTTYIYHNIE